MTEPMPHPATDILRTTYDLPTFFVFTTAMIGTTLRAAREARHLSVRDINVSTNMMIKQIEQIEANDFDGFSAPVYAKGFIKLYARAVGIDAKPLIEEYNRMLRDGDAKPRPPTDLPFIEPSIEGDVSARPTEESASGTGQAERESDRGAVAEGVKPETSREPDLFDRLTDPQPADVKQDKLESGKGEPVANPVALEAGGLPEVRKPVSQPVKRVAPVRPGFQPPVFEVPATRLAERPTFTPPPAARKEGPEPESPIFHAAPHSSRAVTPGELPKPIATKTAPLDLGTPASSFKPSSVSASTSEVRPDGSLFAPETGRETALGRRFGDPQQSGPAVPAESASSEKSEEHSLPVKRPAPDPAATVPVTDPNQPGLFRFLFGTMRDAVLHFCATCKKKLYACAERRVAAKAQAAHLRNHPDQLSDVSVQAPRLRLSKRGKIAIAVASGAVVLLVVLSPFCFLSGQRDPEAGEASTVEADAAFPSEDVEHVSEIQAPTTIAPILKAPYSFAN